MNTTLTASLRNNQIGKGAARKLRASGRLPAVVYGLNAESVAVHVSPKELTDIFAATQDRNTVISLELDGETVPCLIRESQRNPLTRELLHVDFVRVSEERAVQVSVPVRTTGKAVGLGLGGKLRIVQRTVNISCGFTKIPKEIVVDITKMDIGDFIKASELPLPEGVALVADNDFNVISIYGKRAAATSEQVA